MIVTQCRSIRISRVAIRNAERFPMCILIGANVFLTVKAKEVIHFPKHPARKIPFLFHNLTDSDCIFPAITNGFQRVDGRKASHWKSPVDLLTIQESGQ